MFYRFDNYILNLARLNDKKQDSKYSKFLNINFKKSFIRYS